MFAPKSLLTRVEGLSEGLGWSTNLITFSEQSRLKAVFFLCATTHHVASFTLQHRCGGTYFSPLVCEDLFRSCFHSQTIRI